MTAAAQVSSTPRSTRHVSRGWQIWGVVAVCLGMLMGMSACGSSASDKLSGIVVTDAKIPVPAAKDVAAVYLVVTNTGKQDDALEAVTTSAGGEAEVHASIVEHSTSTMKPAGALTVKSGATLQLAPGGYHVMIMNPTKALREGDRVEVTLRFRHAGKVTTQATVIDPQEAFAGSAGSDGHDEPHGDTGLTGDGDHGGGQ